MALRFVNLFEDELASARERLNAKAKSHVRRLQGQGALWSVADSSQWFHADGPVVAGLVAVEIGAGLNRVRAANLDDLIGADLVEACRKHRASVVERAARALEVWDVLDRLLGKDA